MLTLCSFESLCILRPHNPDEVREPLFTKLFFLSLRPYVIKYLFFHRGAPLIFHLSITVTPAGTVSLHFTQSSLPAWSYPSNLWAWVSEAVTAAEVNPEKIFLLLLLLWVFFPQNRISNNKKITMMEMKKKHISISIPYNNSDRALAPPTGSHIHFWKTVFQFGYIKKYCR